MRSMLFAAAALLLATPAFAQRDGTAGNPPSTALQRAYDRATDSPATPADGTPGNPSGTAAARALDRAAGTNLSGAYPHQRDGTAVNPPGTALSREVDRTAPVR